jgi:hypothetical protein
MDASTDASHVFRFREIHFDRHWRPHVRRTADRELI